MEMAIISAYVNDPENPVEPAHISALLVKGTILMTGIFPPTVRWNVFAKLTKNHKILLRQVCCLCRLLHLFPFPFTFRLSLLFLFHLSRLDTPIKGRVDVPL